MDPNLERGLLNQVIAPLDQARDLTDPATADRMADGMLGGRFFAAPVTDLAEAIDAAVARGSLPAQTVALSRRHAEPELLDFLRRLQQALAARKPWPARPFTRLDIAEWATFGGARAVARVHGSELTLGGRLKSFDSVATGNGRMPVLVLRLASDDVVAVMGSVDPSRPGFVLLQRDPGDPDGLIRRFREATGMSADEVVPIPA